MSDINHTAYTSYLFYILVMVAAYLFLRGLRWFFDPYFIYSRRRLDKDIEFFINGKKMTKSQTGLPFLLRKESINATTSDQYISKKDLCGLGLVVPCYNEEKRLPSMLKEHIEYI